MAVTGDYIKRMDAATDEIVGHVDYIRWVSKSAAAGDEVEVKITERKTGGVSLIAFCADGPNMIDLAWLNRSVIVTINSIDSGFIESYMRAA